MRYSNVVLLTLVAFVTLVACAKKKTPVYEMYETVTIDIIGPMTSESDSINPFTDYKLMVEFIHDGVTYIIPGYYAADGHAAETSAIGGDVWRAKFTPDRIGEWTYTASLYQGDNVAITTNYSDATSLSIQNASGALSVIPSTYSGRDFKAHGRLIAKQGYFQFEQSGKYWMKAGANSPENLLGYVDFDDTYRIKAEARDGEAAAPSEIHKFDSHLQDYSTGDPTWKNGKGKSLVGAINYLSRKGMNSAYFLTLNMLGDGKDVWPYVSPDDFTRFDVSKLDQWDILFQHMQSKGVLLHVVIQETENETMLDNGDTGDLRKLYFNQLIARFGHHLALVWNLGEENGPAHWSPIGQNDAQRKAMASYLKSADPYNHPVLLHTHSYDPVRAEILDSIIGYKDLDGLSLQVNIREGAGEVVRGYRQKSKSTGQPWLITMDEIGEWHTGALTDEEDPTHTSLMRHALWGTMLSGGAGVEWYFGAKHPHNDLTSEDWRQRDHLWDLTNNARSYFEEHLPYWEMTAMNIDTIATDVIYGLEKSGDIYCLYTTDLDNVTMDLANQSGEYLISWYNPISGGPLQEGTVRQVSGGQNTQLGKPHTNETTEDWVILIKRIAN